MSDTLQLVVDAPYSQRHKDNSPFQVTQRMSDTLQLVVDAPYSQRHKDNSPFQVTQRMSDTLRCDPQTFKLVETVN
jgi:hypothetical protein